MTWKTAAILSCVAAVAIISVRYALPRYRDNQFRDEMRARAQTLKDRLDSQFPPGTARNRFEPIVSTWIGWHAVAGGNHYFSVGQQPADEWYCGPEEVGVVVRFSDDQLVSTYVTTWNLNCP